MEGPFYIVGPTGSGKSAVALALAERWDAEIVNGDAFQVYAGLPILTAVPTEAERLRCPHHLYECVPLTENYNARSYAVHAEKILGEIRSRGRRALVVGGSGLYLKALTHGLTETPETDRHLRASLERLSLPARVAWLQRLDPTGAGRMNLRNPRYVTRALEICLLSGQASSVFKKRWSQEATTHAVCGVFLQWDRSELYARINARTRRMIGAGALEEVRAAARPVSETAAKAIGMAELRVHLEGRHSLAEAVAAMQQATRRYAKRQGTWFRREACFHVLPVTERDSPESLAEQIAERFSDLTLPAGGQREGI